MRAFGIWAASRVRISPRGRRILKFEIRQTLGMLPKVGPGVLPFEPLLYGREVEGGGVKFGVHFLPVKGRGNRGTGAAPHGEGGGDRLAEGIAKPIDKNPASTLRFGHLHRYELR